MQQMRTLFGARNELDRSDASGSGYITDVYDEKRGVLLVRYPAWLIVALSLAGVLAFAITGFFGYASRGNMALDTPFLKPWALYFWFCAILLTLQISILRDPRLRGRLLATLIVSVIAIIVFFITQIDPFEFLRQLLEQLVGLQKAALTYTLINFAIITVFWVDTVRRWVRRAQNKAPNAQINLLTGERDDTLPKDAATLSELISGDLIAGAVLTVGLAFLFTTPVVGLFIKGQLDHCTLALPGACNYSLNFVDLAQALFYLPLGLLILALTSLLTGIEVLNPANSAMAVPIPAQVLRGRSGTSNSAMAVTETILTTLRSAIDRQLRGLARNLALSVRSVGWPLLIFVGVYGVAQVATFAQLYLHNDKSFTHAIGYEAPALGWGLAAVLCVVFSAALLVFRWRVAENSLRFLGLIGFVVLITLWIFSLALWGVNRLALYISTAGDGALQAADVRHPWWHPFDLGASTLGSLGALVISVIVLGVRLIGAGGAKGRSAPSAQAVAVGTKVPGATGGAASEAGGEQGAQPPQQ